MSTTNHTTNYELSQYIGSDVTSYLSNYNSDMYKIDAQMKVNADDAADAKSDAASAVATSTTASSNASTALSTAITANSTAEAAQTAATAAQTAAGAAETAAEAALAASASNTIGNLAPAYDPTLTYAVGDLVTYIDPETNQGKLYKCIVAIDVPEAFNINKWDDVTTSEVYSQKPKKVVFTGNEYSTLGDMLTAIFNYLNTVLDEALTEKIDLIDNVNNQYITKYHLANVDVGTHNTFFFSSLSGGRLGNEFNNRCLVLTNNIVSGTYRVETNGSVTYTSIDLTTVPTNHIMTLTIG